MTSRGPGPSSSSRNVPKPETTTPSTPTSESKQHHNEQHEQQIPETYTSRPTRAKSTLPPIDNRQRSGGLTPLLVLVALPTTLFLAVDLSLAYARSLRGGTGGAPAPTTPWWWDPFKRVGRAVSGGGGATSSNGAKAAAAAAAAAGGVGAGWSGVVWGTGAAVVLAVVVARAVSVWAESVENDDENGGSNGRTAKDNAAGGNDGSVMQEETVVEEEEVVEVMKAPGGSHGASQDGRKIKDPVKEDERNSILSGQSRPGSDSPGRVRSKTAMWETLSNVPERRESRVLSNQAPSAPVSRSDLPQRLDSKRPVTESSPLAYLAKEEATSPPRRPPAVTATKTEASDKSPPQSATAARVGSAGVGRSPPRTTGYNNTPFEPPTSAQSSEPPAASTRPGRPLPNVPPSSQPGDDPSRSIPPATSTRLSATSPNASPSASPARAARPLPIPPLDNIPPPPADMFVPDGSKRDSKMEAFSRSAATSPERGALPKPRPRSFGEEVWNALGLVPTQTPTREKELDEVDQQVKEMLEEQSLVQLYAQLGAEDSAENPAPPTRRRAKTGEFLEPGNHIQRIHSMSDIYQRSGTSTPAQGSPAGSPRPSPSRSVGKSSSGGSTPTPELDSPVTLDLSNKNFNEFPADLILPHASNLTRLTLATNYIPALPGSCLVGMQHLTSLDLSNNHLEFIPREIGLLTGLKELILRANFLVDVPMDVGRLRGLEVLDLSRNQITKLAHTLFVGMNSLHYIDLSENKLTNLPSSLGLLHDTLHTLHVKDNSFFFGTLSPLVTALTESVSSPQQLHMARPNRVPSRSNLLQMFGRGKNPNYGVVAGGRPTRGATLPPEYGTLDPGRGKAVASLISTSSGESEEDAGEEHGGSVDERPKLSRIHTAPEPSQIREHMLHQSLPAPGPGRFSLNLPEDIDSHILSRPKSEADSLRSDADSIQTFEPSHLRSASESDYVPSISSSYTDTGRVALASDNVHLQRLLGHLRDAYHLDPSLQDDGRTGAKIISASSTQSAPSSEPLDPDEAKRQAEKAKKKQTPAARAAVAAEVLSTERTYVRELSNLVEVYVNPLESSDILGKQETELVFSNIKTILTFHRDHVLPDLERCAALPDQPLGTALKTLAPFLKMYQFYYNTFDAANSYVAHLSSLAKSSSSSNSAPSTPTTSTPIATKKSAAKKFKNFVRRAKQNPLHSQISLQAFLILPVQRLPRYVLLADELLSRTPPEHPDYANLSQAAADIKRRVAECNEGKRAWEEQEKGVERLSRIKVRPYSVGGGVVQGLVSGRRFLREGGVKVLKIVEWGGDMEGRVDGVAACRGKKDRVRKERYGSIVETRFGGKESSGGSSGAAGGNGGSDLDKEKRELEVCGPYVARYGVPRLTGRELRGFLFTDSLALCVDTTPTSTAMITTTASSSSTISSQPQAQCECDLIIAIKITKRSAELARVVRGWGTGEMGYGVGVEAVGRIAGGGAVVYIGGRTEDVEAWVRDVNEWCAD
ncbi:hypothetical protein HK104_002359 [Borealophlyctis nickersoniae]|nr:hypothetical protein HK104_002359 [Borealophlyctis nickersoniae]